MLRGCGQSRPEIEIKEYITELGFDCKKSKQSAKILNKDHIKFLEIDVLIPSINKGIEFDGRYWHTFESLKKSRKDWPEEDIVNYHEIKDRFFELKGIKILHIKEDDWILDKEKCLEQIKFFILNEVK